MSANEHQCTRAQTEGSSTDRLRGVMLGCQGNAGKEEATERENKTCIKMFVCSNYWLTVELLMYKTWLGIWKKAIAIRQYFMSHPVLETLNLVFKSYQVRRGSLKTSGFPLKPQKGHTIGIRLHWGLYTRTKD